MGFSRQATVPRSRLALGAPGWAVQGASQSSDGEGREPAVPCSGDPGPESPRPTSRRAWRGPAPRFATSSGEDRLPAVAAAGDCDGAGAAVAPATLPPHADRPRGGSDRDPQGDQGGGRATSGASTGSDSRARICKGRCNCLSEKVLRWRWRPGSKSRVGQAPLTVAVDLGLGSAQILVPRPRLSAVPRPQPPDPPERGRRSARPGWWSLPSCVATRTMRLRARRSRE